MCGICDWLSGANFMGFPNTGAISRETALTCDLMTFIQYK